MKRLFKMATLATAMLTATGAMADTVSIGRMDVHDLKSTYFQLDESQKLEVEFLAPKQSEDDNNDFVWIVDLDSRETVWRSRRADIIDEDKSDKMDLFGDTVRLDKGNYALYFSTHNFSYRSNAGMDFFLYGLSSLLTDRNRITHDDIEQMYVDLRGKNISTAEKRGSFKPFGEMPEVVKFRKVGKNEYEEFGLHATKDTELGIYAIGEIVGRDLADSARLKNIDTGEVVWEMTKKTTRSAGGASKNRKFQDVINLPKGHYVLSYASDDSHHYNNWNSRPPYDPQAWGISVYGKNKSDVELFNPTERLKALEILSIDRVGDDAYHTKHFKLDKATNIRVHALGERGGRKSMVDYGWIVDNEDMSKVWEMKARKTAHAGGSSKNRVIDEVIELPAGEYTVHYASDDSHSYGDGWNASSPFDGDKWGITLYGAGDNFDKSNVELMKSANKNTLAQIIGIRDSERRSTTFELDNEQKVRVYAIGEGDRDEMFDYAYIKSLETGKRVWYMFPDETEHAGGARKNRVTNETITLPAGKYKVFYRSDGSHSFGDWNDRPPKDQYNYGVTVFAVK